MTRLFTVELAPDAEKVEIHLNRDGFSALRRFLDEAERGGDVHLVTPEWGGTELTGDAQSPENRLIPHLSVWGYPRDQQWPHQVSSTLVATIEAAITDEGVEILMPDSSIRMN